MVAPRPFGRGTPLAGGDEGDQGSDFAVAEAVVAALHKARAEAFDDLGVRETDRLLDIAGGGRDCGAVCQGDGRTSQTGPCWAEAGTAVS